MAIIRDKPMAASHAERVNIIRGARDMFEDKLLGQMARPIKMVSIMASKQSKADRRWVR